MEGGVKNAARRLKNEGIDPDIQVKLDHACVAPHVHPRSKRNSE